MTKNDQNQETDAEIIDNIMKNVPITLGPLRTQREPSELITLNELLAFNSSVILLLTDRLKGKRFRPQQGNAVRLGYIRALIQALQSYNEILKGCELEELEWKVSALERR